MAWDFGVFFGKKAKAQNRERKGFHMASEERQEATAQEGGLLDTDCILNGRTEFTFESILSKVHCKITAHW